MAQAAGSLVVRRRAGSGAAVAGEVVRQCAARLPGDRGSRGGGDGTYCSSRPVAARQAAIVAATTAAWATAQRHRGGGSGGAGTGGGDAIRTRLAQSAVTRHQGSHFTITAVRQRVSAAQFHQPARLTQAP